MIHSIVKPTYAYTALEPFVDAATMELHTEKHHQGYADKLNAALADRPELQDYSLNNLLTSPITKDQAQIINPAGGVANHNFFWTILSPKIDQLIPEPINSALATAFGSVDTFRITFTDQATKLFGSGWVWLTQGPGTNHQPLQIISTPNQDSPVSKGLTPLLALDLWEHAYYLKYQNRRPEFIEAFWHVVNWEEVNHLYQQESAAL